MGSPTGGADRPLYGCGRPRGSRPWPHKQTKTNKRTPKRADQRARGQKAQGPHSSGAAFLHTVIHHRHEDRTSAWLFRCAHSRRWMHGERSRTFPTARRSLLLLQVMASLHQEEIRKQGWVYKESALLRQYRKRWLVLTPVRLYTFKKERVYDAPTEVGAALGTPRLRHVLVRDTNAPTGRKRIAPPRPKDSPSYDLVLERDPWERGGGSRRTLTLAWANAGGTPPGEPWPLHSRGTQNSQSLRSARSSSRRVRVEPATCWCHPRPGVRERPASAAAALARPGRLRPLPWPL